MATYITDQDILNRLNPDFNFQLYRTVVDSSVAAREAYVDGCLSKRYTVPVTGTVSLKIVKSIVADFVAGDVLLAARQNEDSPIEEAERYPVGVLQRRAGLLLAMLVNGDSLLPDAPTAGDTAYTGTDGYDSLDDEDKGDLEPAFRRNMFSGKEF